VITIDGNDAEVLEESLNIVTRGGIPMQAKVTLPISATKVYQV